MPPLPLPEGHHAGQLGTGRPSPSPLGRPERCTGALLPPIRFPRFDLIDSTYAVALMADQTPLWREVYHRILDQLVFRHAGRWSANDWLIQFGHDPARGDYDDFSKLLVPQHLTGEYDVPGWTANGIEPWGLQWDPIAGHLARQWQDRPEGCHCENTKIWPLCITAAGFGLQLHEVLHGTSHHQAFDRWWTRGQAGPPGLDGTGSCARGHLLLRPDHRAFS